MVPPVYMRYIIGKFVETESRTEVSKGPGEGRVRV